MKLRPVFVLSVLMFCHAPFALAQNRSEPPALINQGLLAYAQNGLNTALQLWLHNSLHTVALTPRVTRVYLVLYYERAPLWAWFDLYRTRQGTEVISDVFFSPKVQVILPSALLAQ
jgi:hypothetical protein